MVEDELGELTDRNHQLFEECSNKESELFDLKSQLEMTRQSNSTLQNQVSQFELCEQNEDID